MSKKRTLKPRKTRICQICGIEYVAGYNRTFCSVDCMRKHYDSIQADIDAHPEDHPLYVQKQCISCGRSVLIGRNATKCAACQKMRVDQSSRDTYQRRLAGTIKKVGTECICDVCGGVFNSTSPKQRHCTACAYDAYKATWRERARKNRNAWTEEKKEQRSAYFRKWYVSRKEKNKAELARHPKTADVDAIIARYLKTGTIKPTAAFFHVSHATVTKILCTAGVYPNATAERVHQLLSSGISPADAAAQLGISKKVMDKYTPYTKGTYLTPDKSKMARYLFEWRKKKKTKK